MVVIYIYIFSRKYSNITYTILHETAAMSLADAVCMAIDHFGRLKILTADVFCYRIGYTCALYTDGQCLPYTVVILSSYLFCCAHGKLNCFLIYNYYNLHSINIRECKQCSRYLPR